MTTRFIHHLLAAAPLVALLAACTPPPATRPTPVPGSLESLYLQSIYNATVYRHENVLPLFAVPDSAVNVRVVTFTNWAGYTAGSDSITQDVWVTLVPEVRDSCAGFRDDDLRLRLAQLLGMPPSTTDSLMVEMTVPVRALFRPAVNPDPTNLYPCGDTNPADCGQVFPKDVAPAHVLWMANNMLTTWEIPGGYPWTRLGYTYNWHPGSPRYGASEYLIRSGTMATGVTVQTARAYCGR